MANDMTWNAMVISGSDDLSCLDGITDVVAKIGIHRAVCQGIMKLKDSTRLTPLDGSWPTKTLRSGSTILALWYS
jgi:hypothetical protein